MERVILLTGWGIWKGLFLSPCGLMDRLNWGWMEPMERRIWGWAGSHGRVIFEEMGLWRR